MRKLILIVGLIVVGVACGDALSEMLDSGVPDAGAETPGDGGSMQYVGNSTKTFSGDLRIIDQDGSPFTDGDGNQIERGIFDHYAACQETFGPGHRTCTRNEILFTTKIPQLDGKAWFGIEAGCDPNSDRRSAVGSTGAFTMKRCDYYDSSAAKLPIACCGPK